MFHCNAQNTNNSKLITISCLPDTVYTYWVQKKIPPVNGVSVVLMREFLRVLLSLIDFDWVYRRSGRIYV